MADTEQTGAEAGATERKEPQTLPRVLSTPSVILEPIFNVAPEPEAPKPKPKANIERRVVIMERGAPRREKPNTLSDIKI